MEYEIRHNPDENRFEAVSNEEIIGVANYYIEDDVVIVTHTGVESKHEGQGIAGELTKNLLVYVAMNNFKVNPMCSYTRIYIERRPEYHSLMNDVEYDDE